jgi:hypothetical protein
MWVIACSFYAFHNFREMLNFTVFFLRLRWGKTVSLHPYPVILCCLCVTGLAGLGFLRFRYNDDFHKQLFALARNVPVTLLLHANHEITYLLLRVSMFPLEKYCEIHNRKYLKLDCFRLVPCTVLVAVLIKKYSPNIFTNGANVFCFLSSLLLLPTPATTTVFGSLTCHLSTFKF